MLLAPRYYGLDLPVYDPDAHVELEPRLNRNDIPRERILRAVHVRAPRLLMGDLCKVLRKTDKELNKIADMCGGVVAQHEWGLYPIEEIPKGFEYMFKRRDLNRLGVPAGHIVVADVEWIQKGDHYIFRGNKPFDTVEAGLKEYYSTWGLKQGDADVRQFVFDPSCTPVYVDMDPALIYNNPRRENF